MYQTHTHEISGKPVVDANKYALQVLDRTACKHLGIQNQERALIGVRGQRKDMGRGFLSLFSPVFFLSPRLTLRWMGVWKGVWKGVCAHLHGWWMHCVAYSMHPV